MKIKYQIFLLIISCIYSINTHGAGWESINNAQEAKQLIADIDAYRDSKGNTVTSGNSASNVIIDIYTNTVTITCDNGAGITTTLSDADINDLVIASNANQTNYDISIVNTAPPPPVITTSSSTSNGISSYLSSWSESWSMCSISGTWNSDGTIKCIQTSSYSPNYSSCGTETCTTTYSDGVATGTSCSTNYSDCGADASKPASKTVEKTVTASINSPISGCYTNIFADNYSSCSVGITISANTNQNKKITNWGSNLSISGITDLSGEGSNRINSTGKALNFSGITVTDTTGFSSTQNNFNVTFSGIKSRSPFSSNNGKIGFTLGGTTITLNNIRYDFKKPFIGIIETWNSLKNDWSGKPILGTIGTYKLKTEKKASNLSITTSSYSLNDFKNNIKPYGEGINTEDNSVSGSTLNDINGTIFFSRINTNSGATSLNNTPGLQIDLPIISYTLGGENVSYKLSEKTDSNDITPIKTVGEGFLGIKVIGNLQADGKQEMTGQGENFSNISTSVLRNQIRKNALTYVSQMTHNQVINGVKYIEGDISIEGDNLGFETLVVKDGNVIITGNLNSNNEKLGIIVIKDNYNTSYDYATMGNIYVKPNVNIINSLLYADGGVISVNNSGNIYSGDSNERTLDLKKQLIIKGSVFSKNTIGGAILAGGNYLLPGGEITSNFDIALQYDMNYIRRNNEGCDKNLNNTCTDTGEYKDPFIILYNSKLSSNPPKLFTN